MRCFIAINLTDPYFIEVQNLLHKNNLKATYPKTFHITIKFLGELTEFQVQYHIKKIQSLSFQPFEITTNTIGYFTPTQPRVIYVGVKDSQQLIDLKEKIIPNQELIPHITIARIKFIKNKRELKDHINQLKIKEKTFQVNKVTLYKSTLTSQGPHYEVLAESQ